MVFQKVTLRKPLGRLFGSILSKPPFAVLTVTFTLGNIHVYVSRTSGKVLRVHNNQIKQNRTDHDNKQDKTRRDTQISIC